MPARSTRRSWPAGCAATGASRPACTGSATWSSARTPARFAPPTARPTSSACAPWRSTPYAWPVIRTSPLACDNTPEHRCCRWPPSGSCDDFAETLGPGRGALPAQLGPTGGAGGAARGRPGGVGLGGSVLDAAPDRRGRARAVRRGLHPARAGSAAAPAGLERAGPGPARGRTRRAAARCVAGGDLAGDKRTAADLGAWLVCEDESGQGLRPPKGRTWGRRGRTPVVRVTAAISPRVSVAALVAIKPGRRPRLIYRTHPGRRRRRRDGWRKGFTEADYAALLDAAHQQLGGPIVLVWDNLSTHTSKASCRRHRRRRPDRRRPAGASSRSTRPVAGRRSRPAGGRARR